MRSGLVRKYVDKYSLGVVETGNSLRQYESFFRNMGIGKTIEQLIAEKLGQKPLVRVMDIGCGDGGFLLDIKGIFGERVHTIGIDLLAPEKEPDEAIVGDCLEVPFPKEADFVFSFRSLHEIGEPEKIVGKVHAALAPGGKAFLSFRTMDLYVGGVGIAELGEKEVKALQKMVRSRKLGGFSVQGFEVTVKDDKGKKHTAGVNVILEK